MTPSLPPGSLPPGSLPPGSLPPGSLPPGSPLAGGVAFVLNPAAGSGAAARRLPEVRAAIAAAGIRAEVHVSSGPGQVEALARRLAETHGAVVAVGGDGTIHDAVNALAGTETRLGAVPLGTGNDFAQAVGLPRRLRAAVAALARGRVRTLDVGVARWTDARGAHRRVFANAVGIGLDAAAAAAAGRSKWLGGRTAYAAAVFKTLWAWRAPGAGVEVRVSDGAGAERLVFRGPLLLCEIGNGPAVGGGFRLTPAAAMDDGRLDVCVVRHAPTARVLRILPTAFTGGHVRYPEVDVYPATRVSVRALTGALPVHADGEGVSGACHELTADVWPSALRVIVPA